jgi:hypothetical protein
LRPPEPNRDGDPDRDGEELADELADGSLDPDEAPASIQPWDEGADDEL